MGVDLGTISVRLGALTSDFNRKMGSATALVEQHQKGLMAIAGAGAAAAAAIVLVAGKSVKVAAEFGASMTRVAAIADTNTAGFEALKNKALEVAATTQFTARQMAKGMEFFAMAGLGVKNTLNAIGPAAELAAAGAVTMGEAADVTTSIMAAFGKEASDLTDVNNILVRAITRSKTNIAGFGVSMKHVGAIGKAAGQSLEDIVAMLSMMGNAGVDASMAGTGLKMAMSRLMNQTPETADALEDLGVNAKKAGGDLRNMTDIVVELEKAGASAEQMMIIFGNRAGPAMTALLGQGGQTLKQFSEGLRSGTTAAQIAEKQMGTLAGQMLILQSITERAAIEWGDAMAPAVRLGVSALQKLMTFIGDIPLALKQIAVVLAAVVAAFGALASAIAVVLIALPMLQAGMAAWGALSAKVALRVAAAFWPVVAAIAAIAAGIAGAIIIVGIFRKAYEKNIGGIQEKWDAFVKFHEDMLALWWSGIKGFASSFVSLLSKAFNLMADVFVGMVNDMLGALDFLVSSVQKAANFTAKFFGAETDITGEGGTGIGRVEKKFDSGDIDKNIKDFFASLPATAAEELPKIWATTKELFMAGLGDVGTQIGEILDNVFAKIITKPDAGGAGGGLSDEQLKSMQEAMEGTARAWGDYWTASANRAILQDQLEQKNADYIQSLIDERAGRLASTVGVVGEVVDSAMGNLGGLMSSVSKGLSQGGPIGGLVAGIGALMTKTKAWKKIQGILGKVFAGLVKAIEPVVKAMVPLFKAFGDLFSAVAPLFNILQILTPLFKLVGGILRVVGIILGAVVRVVAAIWNTLLEIVAAVVSIFSEKTARDIRKMKIDTDPKPEKAKDENTDAVNDNTSAMGDMAETAREVSSELANVPEGFKIALARLDSIMDDMTAKAFGGGGIGDGVGSLVAAGGGVTVNVGGVTEADENFVNMVNDEREWEQLNETGGGQASPNRNESGRRDA